MVESRNDRAENAWGLGCLKLTSRVDLVSLVYLYSAMFYILFRLQVLFNLLIFNSYYCSFTKAFQGYLFIIKTAFAFEESLVSFFCCCVFHACPLEMKPYGVPGGGTQQSFIREGSALRSNPLPFYIPFLTKKIPFSYIFYWQMVPLSQPIVELCIFLNCCKRTFKISINHKTRTFFRLFQNHKMHLLAPLGLFAGRKWQISLPFHILQLVKFLPVHLYLKPERGTPNLIPRVLSHPSKGRRENLGTRLRLPEAVNRLNSRPPLDTNWLGYSMFTDSPSTPALQVRSSSLATK